MHALMFVIISSVFLFTPPGLIIAFVVSYIVRRLEETVVLDDGYRNCKLIAAYGRLVMVQTGIVASFRGHEPELEVMYRAVEDAQPVQYTLTKAFATKRSSRSSSGAGSRKSVPAAEIIESEAHPAPPRSPATGKRLRRPAPLRLLRLALETRREAVDSLRDLVKAVKEEGTDRQREAWWFLEQNGAKLS